MHTPSLQEMFHRLLQAQGRGPAAWTVEVFGWLILVEGGGMLFLPRLAEQLLRLGPQSEQAEHYLRLVGLLVAGLGALYVVSGRLNAQGFVFASLLDRPLVPPAMLVLWWQGILPGTLALAFAAQDFAGFLWTLSAWRAQQRCESAERPKSAAGDQP